MDADCGSHERPTFIGNLVAGATHSIIPSAFLDTSNEDETLITADHVSGGTCPAQSLVRGVQCQRHDKAVIRNKAGAEGMLFPDGPRTGL